MRRWSARTQHAAGARGSAAGGHRPGAAGGDPAERPGPHGAPPNDKNPPLWMHRARQGPGGAGRSRGGLTSKIHLLADAGCRPLARVTSAGQRHDSLAFAPLMDRLKIARRGRRRPRTRPGQVLADKAYSSTAIRAHLRRRGIKATIPEPADQIRHRLRRGSSGGRRRIRPRRLQGAQYRRARLYRLRRAPGGRHPVRQTRLRSTGHRRRRRDPHLAPRPHPHDLRDTP